MLLLLPLKMMLLLSRAAADLQYAHSLYRSISFTYQNIFPLPLWLLLLFPLKLLLLMPLRLLLLLPLRLLLLLPLRLLL